MVRSYSNIILFLCLILLAFASLCEGVQKKNEMMKKPEKSEKSHVVKRLEAKLKKGEQFLPHYNVTALARLFENLYGPKTYLVQFGTTTSQLTFRTLSLILSAAFYHYMKERYGDTYPEVFENLDFYFNQRTYETTILRNFRNWTMLLFGRFVLNNLVWGPFQTFDLIFRNGQITTAEIGKFLLRQPRTIVFVIRMMTEAIGLVTGWMIYVILGSILWRQVGNPRPLIQYPWRKPRSIEDYDYFDQKFQDNYKRIVKKLENSGQNIQS